MLIIANAYRRLNLWSANCGASFEWVGRAINPYLGFLTGWLMVVTYIVGTVAGVIVLGPSILAVTGAESASKWAYVGIAVALGQPRPGVTLTEQPGDLRLQRFRGPWPLDHAAEIGIEPDDLHGHPRDHIEIRGGRPPDPHPRRAASGYRRPPARGPCGDDAERRQPVGHQSSHPGHITARPANQRGGVLAGGFRHRSPAIAGWPVPLSRPGRADSRSGPAHVSRSIVWSRLTLSAGVAASRRRRSITARYLPTMSGFSRY
jgi:hypothetical protein